MTDELYEEPGINKPLIGVAIAVVIAAAAGGYYWYGRTAVSAKAPQVAEPIAPAPAAAPEEARIEHPLPAEVSSTALPDLNDSDKAIGDALGQAVGADAAASFLVRDSIIRHIVVTIDNLPRQKLPVDKRPIVPVPGTFAAVGDELHATLDSRNFRRYAPMIDVLRKLDMQRIAEVYFRFYPLLQKSYEDLGYPYGYFNDRLVQVIDDLLKTPQIAGPIELTRPNVLYVFADQSLESRSAGQKLLLRMGPDNAAVVKAKLAELRTIVTAAPPHH
jgi:hypothetical protein